MDITRLLDDAKTLRDDAVRLRRRIHRRPEIGLTLGREDFSYVLQRVPGALTFLGTRPDDGPAHPNHSNRMRVNESALTTGIALHAAVALRFLERHRAA
jgi:metal-dependent amidase/aminoacylase/carboxypeptidase family protein